MKVALAQINCHIGNFESNTSRIISMIQEARQGGAELVIFPEMVTSGYPPLDFLDFADFIRKCETAVTEIAKVCTGIAAIVGSPSPNPVLKGKNLYNSAYFLTGGKIQKIIHKTLLPTYNIFDEYRYFEPNTEFGIIEINGTRIALTVCEDLWNEEDDPLYVFSPMEKIMPLQPSLMVNIAASPFDYEQEEKRKAILIKNVRKYGLPLIYVNHVGAQTDIIFDGGSLVINENGKIVSELAYFKEELRIVETEKIATMQPVHSPLLEKSQRIYEALVMGIRDYFMKMNFTKATLGLSGGVDSALVLVLAAEALGKENVFPVMMPSAFSTEHSLTDSIKLADNLDIDTVNIPINIIYDNYISELIPFFKDLPFNTTEENIQARIRGTLLMALSNKFGYILLNTSNKSELAVGYGTLYGDMCGGLSVLGDVYKTEIYDLCRYINRDREIIPESIIVKPPSAELRPGQKDTDSLPDYKILDPVLYQYIEKSQGPDELIAQGYDPRLVHRVLKMVNTNEYKRFQFAPILRVSPIAFGRGRRMPLAAKYLS